MLCAPPGKLPERWAMPFPARKGDAKSFLPFFKRPEELLISGNRDLESVWETNFPGNCSVHVIKKEANKQGHCSYLLQWPLGDRGAYHVVPQFPQVKQLLSVVTHGRGDKLCLAQDSEGGRPLQEHIILQADTGQAAQGCVCQKER